MPILLIDEIDQLRNHLKQQDREIIHELRDCLNLQMPIDRFERIQSLVLRISNQFGEFGWPPLRVQASYFSQDRENADFEISWLRNDLRMSTGGNSRTAASHGPAFRLILGKPQTTAALMSNRFDLDARTIFIKNVLSSLSSRWIEPSIAYFKYKGVDIKWASDWQRVFEMEELRDLATFVSKSKDPVATRNSYFYASNRLKANHFENEDGLPLEVVKFFVKMAPLFWGHHFRLEPKPARTKTQTSHQISREQLRKNVLRIESRCQNADCPLDGGDPRMLKVAHLTPQINLLSNAIVLCPLCYDAQFPATSVIRVRTELESSDPKRKEYSVEIETRDGPKFWRVSTNTEHPLSNPRT
jgi:hypothetical protein